MKCLCTVLFALFLGALSLCNIHKTIRRQRDEATELSRKEAYEYCDLHNQLRDTENKLYYANERLQEAENGMDDERRQFRDTIQELHDQHLVAKEEVLSLEQHLSNTDCDREEYSRLLAYADRDNQKLAREIEKLKWDNQQLESSLTEKDETISDLQAHQNDTNPEPVAAVSQTYINTQPNDEIEVHPGLTTVLPRGDTAPEQATADGKEFDAHRAELELLRDAHAKCGENLEHQVAAHNGQVSERDDRIKDLQQQNGKLTSDVGGLRTDLKHSRDEHAECSGHLKTQLAQKDKEMEALRAEKKTLEEDSAKDLATLRANLGGKEQEVKELKESLAADSASSAETTQQLNTLRDELQLSRSAHAQCDENSNTQRSRIDQLVTAKEQLEETLRLQNDELVSLQGQIAPVQSELEELKETHARCGEHANRQGSRITQLRSEIGVLQEKNYNILQQNSTSQELQSGIQREIRSLQGINQTLSQTIDDQQQRIFSLETNCPTCQKLREALNEVVKDVEMSDADDKLQSERDLRESVRAELRSQVTDDLRRHVRGEVEREIGEKYRQHYSDALDRNSRRITEQDKQISEKNAEIQRIKRTPIVDHTACETRETKLQSTITRLQQDVSTAKERSTRSSNEARRDREQLTCAQTTIADLRNELETIKADQRRAQNTSVNPLQGKLTTCQRELKQMKEDRDKARNNCSTYSKLLSDEKKNCKVLEDKLLAFENGDSKMDDARTEEAVAVQDEQRKARDSAQSQAMDNDHAPSGDQEGEQQASTPARRLGPRPARLRARQLTPNHVLEGGRGKKREHDEFSDGEADDEGGDDRKKVKTVGEVHRLSVPGNH